MRKAGRRYGPAFYTQEIHIRGGKMLLRGLGYLYTAVLAGLSIYALHVLLLIALYLRHRNEPQPDTPALDTDNYPMVTVQIPLRNEQYVVQRVLQAVANFDWPQDRLEIQVLDDSDDQTTELAQEIVQTLRQQGLNIYVLHRQQAQGHKAGALAAGLRRARGEFIAIFDADFCPESDFLKRTIPHFEHDANIGMIQARWGHLNAEYSAITRAQALLMDAHFTVEHIARNRSGLLMNFNGTAGVWRREAIVDAGGWQSNTVAEDLDLSYRAQLRGWKARYLPDVVAPAELPPLVAAFKQQQYRWAKGATQVLRKLAGPILRSEGHGPFAPQRLHDPTTLSLASSAHAAHGFVQPPTPFNNSRPGHGYHHPATALYHRTGLTISRLAPTHSSLSHHHAHGNGDCV
jgi:cellulose synthase/poly-beta-1,6-N-acetylglucosamine synthase-like glycosyltransferase